MLHQRSTCAAVRDARLLCQFRNINTKCDHVSWVPCHDGMARPQVETGGNGLQIGRVAAKILNKQSRTADKGWSSSLGVGRGANTSSP
jgi:hypothetical protein